MDAFIPLSVPNLGEQELTYTAEAIRTNWVSTAGTAITRFEEQLASYCKVEVAVACQSGTAGLHLSLLSLGIGKGDLVIVPTLTFIGAVNPVHYVGAQPIFMDCDDTLCMDMEKLRQFLAQECTIQDGQLIEFSTSRPIKAVVVVHVFGNIADMEALMDLASQYRLLVIEDATEALGSYIKDGRYVGMFAGTIGHIGVYSFNGNKIITTGGGGMVVSHDVRLLARVRYLSTQAKDDETYFIHNEIGYNYRMTTIQATVGLAQLEKLENFIRIKAENYARYVEQGIHLLPFRSDIRPNYWFYSMTTERRDALIAYLRARQIQARPVWHLIHDLKPYKKSRSYCIERAWQYWERIVNIPCSTNLSEANLSRVVKAIHAF